MTPTESVRLGLAALLLATSAVVPALAQETAPATPPAAVKAAPTVKTAPPAKVKAPEKTPADTAKPAVDAKAAADAKPAADAKATADAKPAADAKATSDAKPTASAKAADTAKPAPDSSPAAAPVKVEGKVETKPAKAVKPAGAKDATAAGTSTDTIKKAADAGAKAAATVNPGASDPEAEQIWKAYEARWAETADYAAGFRQSIEVADVGTKIESGGRFFFAKPDLVRWEYTEGPPQTVVGDGQTIWLYQPDLEQVYKIPYAKAFGRGGLVALLAGRKGVSERYVTTLQRPDAATVTIHLKPKEKGEEDLEVRLNAESFDLQGVTVKDAAGSITRMTFTEPQRNRGSDKAHFAFSPPQGVDIITDQQTSF